MNRLCNYCNTEYIAEQRYLNRGQGLFCSRACSSKHRSSNRDQVNPNTSCAWCQAPFYIQKSKLGTSKSGLNFCSRSCKDRAQRIGGIQSIMPEHYNSGQHIDYRKLAFDTYARKCRACGWNKYPEVLEVNHIDCDRSNNSLENLEILCPTCHRIYHYLGSTGPWNKTRRTGSTHQ